MVKKDPDNIGKAEPYIPGEQAADATNNYYPLDQLADRLIDNNNEGAPAHVAFPQCADLLLSLIQINRDDKKAQDEIEDFFNEYFINGTGRKHEIFTGKTPSNLICGTVEHSINSLHGCLPPSCVTFGGERGSVKKVKLGKQIRRLFAGDIIWLFYMDRLGLFKLLAKILDDYTYNGKFPIYYDNVTAIVLEAMARQFKMGLFSSTRDRDSTYRRCLGWTTPEGRKLNNANIQVNEAFNQLFHKFIQLALNYYNAKRLAKAIQLTASSGGASVSTLVSIIDTLDVLRKSLTPSSYGRNYHNILSGIVWAIASIGLIDVVKTSIGIPDTYTRPYQFISAAYDLLIEGKSLAESQPNRYKLHYECARDARDVLMDIHVLNIENEDEVSAWLDAVEDRIEGYRTAYRELTGEDLGKDEQPPRELNIEQKV